LKSLIEAYDILYCYLWLAYRFEVFQYQIHNTYPYPIPILLVGHLTFTDMW
jgi:hypothetical protein